MNHDTLLIFKDLVEDPVVTHAQLKEMCQTTRQNLWFYILYMPG